MNCCDTGRNLRSRALSLLRWAVEGNHYSVVTLIGLQGHLLLRLEVFSLEFWHLVKCQKRAKEMSCSLNRQKLEGKKEQFHGSSCLDEIGWSKQCSTQYRTVTNHFVDAGGYDKRIILPYRTSWANTASGVAVESTHDALIEITQCPPFLRK